MTNHGFVDILEFENSVKNLYIKELFKQSFLNNQLQILKKLLLINNNLDTTF